jgi:hypothetical protein
MEQTVNLKLGKPLPSEKYDVAVFNGNADILDSSIGNLNTQLNSKVDKVSGKELSTNDLTNALKQNYDSAYSHSTSTHAPANAEKNTIVTIKQNGKNLTPDDNRIVDLGTVLTGGEQTSTSSADGGSNVYTFSNGSTITVKNGSKGSQGNPGKDGTNGTNGTSVTVTSVSESDADGGNNTITFSDGTIITIKNGTKGSVGATGSAGTKGEKGDKGDNGVTPTIKAAAGTNIGSVGTPTVTASTSGTTTTFTFDNLKGAKGDKGDAGTNATTTAVATISANGLMSSSDKSKLDGIASEANKTTIDSALSSTSTNPVQNKVINTALAGKANSSHTHNVSSYKGGINYSDAMPTALTAGMFWIGNAK